MRRVLLLPAVLLVLPLFGSDSPKEYDARMQREGLHGSWTVVSVRCGGRDEPNVLKDGLLTIQGNHVTILKNGVKEEEGILRIDATTRPARLDYTTMTGNERGPTLPMIYRLDGDRLTIGFIFQLNLVAPAPPPKRPANFEENEVMIIILKRGK